MLISITLLLGCQHDPYADWFVKKQVSDEAILGTYRVTDDTVTHFATTKITFLPGGKLPVGPDAKIVLTGDHKIYFSAVPWDALSGQVCVLSGAGAWRLARKDEFASLQVSLDENHAGRKSPGCPDRAFGFYINLLDDSLLPWHSHGKYPLLHLSIGDPDSGDALQFQRE